MHRVVRQSRRLDAFVRPFLCIIVGAPTLREDEPVGVEVEVAQRGQRLGHATLLLLDRFARDQLERLFWSGLARPCFFSLWRRFEHDEGDARDHDERACPQAQ